MQRNRTILAKMTRAMDQAAVSNGGHYKAQPPTTQTTVWTDAVGYYASVTSIATGMELYRTRTCPSMGAALREAATFDASVNNEGA